MVYESGFSTRRTYSSRPVVTSYAVTVYKTSYPIYSTSTHTRVISSPVRIISSPARVMTRVLRSPSSVHVTSATTIHGVTSPKRLTSYTYSTPTTCTLSHIPSTYYSSYLPRYISSDTPSTYVYSLPSYLYSSPVTRAYSRSLSPVRRITPLVRVTPSYLKRTLPGYGARSLTNYLSTEPFTTFHEKTDRICNRAQSLMRDLHIPVVRCARSVSPFSVTGFVPTTDVVFDAYLSRITNPVRHVAQEVHRMSMYSEPAHKYVGKNHPASARICSDKSHNIRRPMHDTDRVRTDINLLSCYVRHPVVKKRKETEEKVESADTGPELDPYPATRKLFAPRPLADPYDDETQEKQHLRQEHFMAVNEVELDLTGLEKRKAQCIDVAKQRKQNALEEEQKREAGEEEQSRLEEEKLAEKVKLAEEVRIAEESRIAEEDRLAEEARLAQETAHKVECAARFAEEQRILEENLIRLAEIEKQAEEECEADLARQAAELAKIAIQETEIAAQELQSIQEIETNANTLEEANVEQRISFEVQQEHEPAIDLNNGSIDTDIGGTTTREET